MDRGSAKDLRLFAYILWLEERGLVFPSRTTVSRTPPVETKQNIEERTPSQLLFVADAELTREESALFVRIQAAIGLSRECAPLLFQARPEAIKTAIAWARPQAVVLLGLEALKKATSFKVSYRQISGKFFYFPDAYGDIPLLATLHPSDLLRHAANKRRAWDDLQLAVTYAKERTLNA